MASAPLMPACSKAGANASAVAGPPASAAVPVSTPNSSGRPNKPATAMPSRPWPIDSAVANPRNSNTCRPPARSSGKLAPNPSEVKNAMSKGDLSVLSKAGGATPNAGNSRMTTATASPPRTAAGRFSRTSTGTVRRSPSPTTRAPPARVSVCMASILRMIPPREWVWATPPSSGCLPSCGRSTYCMGQSPRTSVAERNAGRLAGCQSVLRGAPAAAHHAWYSLFVRARR